MRATKKVAICLNFLMIFFLLSLSWQESHASEEKLVQGLGAGNYYNFPSENDTDGVYEAVTEDGVTLVIKRYRPFQRDKFNEGKQPIILFNGILCSMKEFDVRTVEESTDLYADFQLDKNKIEKWAINDPHIERDPMLYYSIAYYLWSFGYDPWLCHYRGTGRGALESGLDSQGINLDHWGIYDTPAIIDKVYEVTGIPPVIGGHSTGGVVSYIYLQGCYFGKDGHVHNDKNLSKERNEFIRGFIGLDHAGEWPFPVWSNIQSLWAVFGTPIFLPLTSLMGAASNTMLIYPGSPLLNTAEGLLLSLFRADEFTGGNDIFQYLSFMNTANINKYLMDYTMRYLLTSAPLRGLGMYYDYGINHTIREFWKNGEENSNRVVGLKPKPNDGYYYYKDNMYLVTVPSISIFSETEGIVSPTNMVRDFVKAKTQHALDEWMIVPKSGHMDVVVGDNAPEFLYYYLRNWLGRMSTLGYFDN